MKLILAAVMHSPNLGDGVIAACIERAARDCAPQVTLDWLDLAGRTSFADAPEMLRRRTTVLSILDKLPISAQQAVTRLLVTAQVRKHLVPRLPEKFDGAGGVIIGGGQLLSDVHLNFPIKIEQIVAEAEARDIPIALHSVGVAGNWTANGARRFGRLLRSPMLRFVSVRDEASRAHLGKHLSSLDLSQVPDIRLCPDPGFLAADLLHGDAAAAPSHRPRIGVGVTHPVAIRAHSSPSAAVPHRTWVKFYRDLAAELSRNHQVILFTNGSPEDEAMLTEVTAVPRPANAERLARRRDPEALVNFIAGLDGLAAHRLHALIVAYSLNVPSVGFRWDAKVDAFFELTDRRGFLVEAPMLPPGDIADLIAKAGRRIEPKNRRADLRAAAHDGVREAINALMR